MVLLVEAAPKIAKHVARAVESIPYSFFLMYSFILIFSFADRFVRTCKILGCYKASHHKLIVVLYFLDKMKSKSSLFGVTGQLNSIEEA